MHVLFYLCGPTWTVVCADDVEACTGYKRAISSLFQRSPRGTLTSTDRWRCTHISPLVAGTHNQPTTDLIDNHNL